MTGALVEGGQIRIFHLEDDLTALPRLEELGLDETSQLFRRLIHALAGGGDI